MALSARVVRTAATVNEPVSLLGKINAGAVRAAAVVANRANGFAVRRYAEQAFRRRGVNLESESVPLILRERLDGVDFVCSWVGKYC